MVRSPVLDRCASLVLKGDASRNGSRTVMHGDPCDASVSNENDDQEAARKWNLFPETANANG